MKRNILITSIVVLGVGAAVGLAAVTWPTADDGEVRHPADAPHSIAAPHRQDLATEANSPQLPTASRAAGCPYVAGEPVERSSGCCSGGGESAGHDACEHGR